METKTIKHVLASKKDKKPTILNTELLKLNANTTNETVSLYYEDFEIILTYKKSRDGKTWYALSKLPKDVKMPEIGNPIYYKVSLVSMPILDFFNNQKINKSMKLTNEFEAIRQWAIERGIYTNGDPKTQYIKLQEEAGELAKAILKNDEKEFIDAIGDCVVVLTNLAALKGFTIEECINSAYEEIMNRKGKMINGTFVKEQ